LEYEEKLRSYRCRMASNGIHLYVVLATNLLLLLAVVRRAKRSPLKECDSSETKALRTSGVDDTCTD